MKNTDLLSRMTLEEKVALLSGKDFWHLRGNTRLGLPEIMITESRIPTVNRRVFQTLCPQPASPQQLQQPAHGIPIFSTEWAKPWLRNVFRKK